MPILPAEFEPLIVNGYAICGLCIIRVKVGGVWRFDAIAHRVATSSGVYIIRRDTCNKILALAGGRLFPGVHRHGALKVDWREDEVGVRASLAGQVEVSVRAHRADEMKPTPLFEEFSELAQFFRAGSRGWSLARDPRQLEQAGFEFPNWRMTPAALETARSSFWEALDAEPDHAALMEKQPLIVTV